MVRFKFVLDGNKGFDSKYVYFCVIFRVEELVQLPLLSALGQKHHVDPFWAIGNRWKQGITRWTKPMEENDSIWLNQNKSLEITYIATLKAIVIFLKE